jgi:large repetitive protein
VAGGGSCASFTPATVATLAPGGTADFTCTFNAGSASGSWTAAASGTDSLGKPAPTANESTGGNFTVTPPATNICGLTWGYWKNHVSLWPVTSMVLGSQTYSQTELTNILGLSVSGDASINLAHQLIAAKFNVFNGTNPTTDGGAISAADSILSTFSGKLPYNVAPSSTGGTQMTTVAGQLDTFNSDGLAQPGCTAGPAPLTLNCATGTGQVNVVYSSAVTAGGGLQPYTFAIIGGSLPPGLSLNTATGAITGTPTTPGTYSYTVLLEDATAVPGSLAGTVTSHCSITIAPAAQPLTIKCPTASATVGTAYSSPAATPGGTGPYTYSVASGALPSGLTLNAGTGAITGTPSKAGTYTFTLKVVDSKGATATTTSCSIAVAGGIVAGQFTTYTQGGWGAPAKGNNPGALLTSKFTTVYTGGTMSIGGTYKLTYNSALSIINFLPQGGTAGKLTANASNPTTSAAGVLAGQVLALQLNVDFSNKGITAAGFANLHVVSGLAAGQTVAQVLAAANTYLGGAALPAGISYADITAVIDAINNNFDNGTTNNGYLQQ